MKKYIILALLCGCDPGPFPNNYSPNYTSLRFTETTTTPSGVSVDDPRSELDLVLVDQVIAKTLQCMHVSATLPPEFGVKVPERWWVSSCTGSQIFDCNIGNEGCYAKGQTPTAECPCKCRAVVQDNRYIITTPNMVVLPGRLITLITGIENPWADASLADCAHL